MIKHFFATLWQIYFKKVFESTFLLAQKIGWDRRIAAFPPSSFFFYLCRASLGIHPSARPYERGWGGEGGDVLSICFWRTDWPWCCDASPLPLPLDPPALKGRKRPSSSYKMGLGNFPIFLIYTMTCSDSRHKTANIILVLSSLERTNFLELSNARQFNKR